MSEGTIQKASADQGAWGAKVQLENVGKSFEVGGPVVENFHLSIESGEFLALLGPSGCGKSTLLRLIAGLDRPESGEIHIDAFGRRSYRGFVFQDASLLPWKNVLDNVALPLVLTGQSTKIAREQARSALDLVGLADALQKFPNQLSGGMKMRVSVARALVGRPSLLLLDEPFAALDENTRHRLQEELRALWESHRMTTIFVTHSVSEAVYLSSRAVVLSQRPARQLLDARIDLPSPRPPKIRTDPRFVAQMDKIYVAFVDEGVQA